MCQLEERLKNFETLSDRTQRLKEAIEICELLNAQSRLAELEPYVNAALELATVLDDRLSLALAFKFQSLLHYSRLSIDRALESAFRAVKILQGLDEAVLLSNILNNIGVYYTALGIHERGLEYFEQAIELNPQNSKAISNAGERLRDMDRVPEAIARFMQALELADTLGDELQSAHLYKNLGEVHFADGNIDTAEEHFTRALRMGRRLKDKVSSAFALIGLSRVALSRDASIESHGHAREALELAEQLDNNELRWFGLLSLADSCRAIGDDKELASVLTRSLRLHEQLYSGSITQRIAELEATYRLERKELETKRLFEQQARLASIGVMGAGITHEINQPLNAITINADGMLFKDDREKVLPREYRESVEQIHQAAMRIDEIVKHMRSFWSRPDYLKHVSFDLNEGIENALGMIRRQVASHGIALDTSLCKGPVPVLGISIHLQQIVINLVINAMHSLDNKPSGEKRITLTTSRDHACARLRVCDTGEGLPAGVEDRIFDPFYSTRPAG
ncbi:MAG: tetratricopeptide repeat protein, partial [Candidatus Cloacimonetes bacterium]|nr:tetratricopeptide repeat protein [Candidatus Cloacimonadota bacterium]